MPLVNSLSNFSNKVFTWRESLKGRWEDVTSSDPDENAYVDVVNEFASEWDFIDSRLGDMAINTLAEHDNRGKAVRVISRLQDVVSDNRVAFNLLYDQLMGIAVDDNGFSVEVHDVVSEFEEPASILLQETLREMTEVIEKFSNIRQPRLL